MPILSASDEARVRGMLADLPRPVRLVFYTQTLNCETCEPTRQILSELVALSDQLTLDEHNFLLERDGADALGLDRVPAIVPMAGDHDYGIRFFGIPSGYEFMSLLDAIQIVSTGESGLQEESVAALGDLTGPLSVQVFVTPT